MAFTMDFTDNCGVAHTAAYWKVVLLSVDKASKIARVVFYAYVDKASADALKSPLLGGVKEYAVTPEVFETYFATSVLNPANSDPYKSAYDLALATLDIMATPAVSAVPTVPAVKDADGNIVTPEVPEVPAKPAVFKSFFDGAQAV